MKVTAEQHAVRTITDRDFLIGSVWEGTGEEIHVNRHMADASDFGGRILSGISGMLLAVDAVAPDLLSAQPSRLEWGFNGPLLEGDRFEVTAHAEGASLSIEGRSDPDGRPASAGSLVFEPPETVVPVDGIATRGRTYTPADVALFESWLGSSTDEASRRVPWPLVVLLASGLVSRSGYLGEHELTLNRGFLWRFGDLPSVDDTVHCVYGPVRTRDSATRPDLQVGSYDVAVISSVTHQVFANVEWTVMFR